MPGTRIAITENGRVAKVAIIVPFRDGGIAITAPYTSARRGLLVAMRPSPNAERSIIPQDAFVAEYTASDRVKLSIHRDGFTQFSGAGIRSGRDNEGHPRGLAIQMQHPFMYPITTGPTFALTIWGLDDFELLRKRDAANALIFDESDLYYRDASPDRWDNYVIEAFVFPATLLHELRPRGRGRTTMSLVHPAHRGPRVMLDFRVMMLPNQSVFLGFIVSRMQGLPIAADGTTSPGFILSGPRDAQGTGLYAVYPSPYSAGQGPSASLDWDAAAGTATGD